MHGVNKDFANLSVLFPMGWCVVLRAFAFLVQGVVMWHNLGDLLILLMPPAPNV